jgi:endonuclease/exonuclease/phosphatase family metal-dependent hydrolase
MAPAFRFTVATLNIHKGFTPLNAHMMVHELRDSLRLLNPDILFLQEVQGEHSGHAARHRNWPAAAQHEFLAENVWLQSAYGRNVVHQRGHHGNAILSRFPIENAHNQDVTQLRFEGRGLLHCTLRLPAADDQDAESAESVDSAGEALHCVCVHLSLFGRSRRRQMTALAEYLDANIATDAPLIVAGDFNDWRNRAGELLARRLGLSEVFAGSAASKRPARSFPAGLPIFRLDRIYVRGFRVVDANVHFAVPGARLSDHAALAATLARTHHAYAGPLTAGDGG